MNTLWLYSNKNMNAKREIDSNVSLIKSQGDAWPLSKEWSSYPTLAHAFISLPSLFLKSDTSLFKLIAFNPLFKLILCFHDYIH